MKAIIDVHYPGIKQKLVSEALRIFYDMRKVRVSRRSHRPPNCSTG